MQARGAGSPQRTSSLGLIPRIVLLIGGLVGGLTILSALLVSAAVRSYVQDAGDLGVRYSLIQVYGLDKVDKIDVKETTEGLYYSPKKGTEAERSKRVPISVITPYNLYDSYTGGGGAAVLAASIALAVLTFALSYFVALRVTAPLNRIIEDVTEISRGRLEHKIRVTAGGEIAALSRAVSRMVDDLVEKRAAEEEIERRDHDASIADEIRQSLIPDSVPELEGYEIAGTDLAAEEAGGDFFDVLEFEESGRLGFLVSEIAGTGIPSALVMSMARAYLRAEALRVEDPAETLRRANRLIHGDIRRGMYVTALYGILDPKEGTVRLANAGHKMPVLRWNNADRKLQMLQSEGIALGFDAGPVFDRTIREVSLTLDPGDRLVFTTTGIISVKNEEDAELAETGFYRILAKHAAKNSDAFLQLTLGAVSKYSEGVPMDKNIVIVTVKRKA